MSSASRTRIALKQFIRDPEFADAVIAKGENGFSDCLTEVIKGVGASLSDLEAYRRAANLFLSWTAEFSFQLDDLILPPR